jgi:HPt (histidine-containing phosphotransfer) domain-containing protein
MSTVLAAPPVGGTEASTPIAEALRAIWQDHRALLRTRVDQIGAAVAGLSTGDLMPGASREAECSAHMIAGTAGTFGFHRASALAQALELGLSGDGTPDVVRLSGLVRELRDELELG